MRARFMASSWLLALLTVAPATAASIDPPLVRAVKDADRAAVRTLLQQRVDPNQAEPDGTTALHWAARRDDVELVRSLIRAGANVQAVNRYGVTPLMLFC